MYYALMLIVALVKYDQDMYTQIHTINLDYVLYAYVNTRSYKMQSSYVYPHIQINLDYVLCAYVNSIYCKIQPGYTHTDTYN